MNTIYTNRTNIEFRNHFQREIIPISFPVTRNGGKIIGKIRDNHFVIYKAPYVCNSLTTALYGNLDGNIITCRFGRTPSVKCITETLIGIAVFFLIIMLLIDAGIWLLLPVFLLFCSIFCLKYRNETIEKELLEKVKQLAESTET